MKPILYEFPGKDGWSLSPFCNKAHWALRMKGIDYETRSVRFASMSKTRHLPLLDWNGELVHDSSEILRFLETKAAPKLVPSDRRLAAQAHALEEWIDEGFLPAIQFLRDKYPEAKRAFGDIALRNVPAWVRPPISWLRAHTGARRTRWLYLRALGIDAVKTQVQRHLDAADALLENRAWLAGESPTIADLSMAACLHYFTMLDVDIEPARWLRERKHASAWLDRFLDQKRMAA